MCINAGGFFFFFSLAMSDNCTTSLTDGSEKSKSCSAHLLPRFSTLLLRLSRNSPKKGTENSSRSDFIWCREAILEVLEEQITREWGHTKPNLGKKNNPKTQRVCVLISSQRSHRGRCPYLRLCAVLLLLHIAGS